MQSEWTAYGLAGSDNVVLTDVYVAYTIPVVLQGIPGLATTVHLPFLPAPTTGIRLYTAQDAVWYAINATPGPIPDPVLSATVPDDAFVRGDVLLPGAWQRCTLPETPGVPHVLFLVSRTPYVEVTVVALTEII